MSFSLKHLALLASNVASTKPPEPRSWRRWIRSFAPPTRSQTKSSTTHLSERGGLRRVASAARGNGGVPQPARVRRPGEHDERAAAREEDGQRCDVGLLLLVGLVLLDARFVQPHARLGDAAAPRLVAPRHELLVLGGTRILPAVADESLHVPELRRRRLLIQARVGTADEVALLQLREPKGAEPSRPLGERIRRRAAAHQGGDRRGLGLLCVLAAE